MEYWLKFYNDCTFCFPDSLQIVADDISNYLHSSTAVAEYSGRLEYSATCVDYSFGRQE